MLGISLEMQKKTLKLIKELTDMGKKMSGVIIKIENVGHGFCWGANLENLASAGEYFRDNAPEHAFSIVDTVIEMPAGELMQKIHLLNDAEKLPGLFKHLELQQKAA